MTTKVECIDNSNLELYLTVGRIYDVIQEDSIAFYIKSDRKCAMFFMKERFKIASSKATIKVGCITDADIAEFIIAINKIPNKITSKKPEVDVEEERLRAMLRPYIPPGNCICGTVKEVCPYHR